MKRAVMNGVWRRMDGVWMNEKGKRINWWDEAGNNWTSG